MAEGVLMPKAGISVESCIITQWLKKPGDQVSKGDVLFTYETDKASFECESTGEGQLLECFYNDGDEVPVLVAVCALGRPGEDVSGLRPDAVSAPGEASPGEAPGPAKPAPQPPAGGERQSPSPPAAAGALKISPRARRLAERENVDTDLVAPTGPCGRIIERDVRAAMDKAGAPAEPAAPAAESAPVPGGTAALPAYEDIPFSGIRRAIARSMSHSLSSIPQLTHNFSFDATELLAYRARLKQDGAGAGLPNITLNDMILFAVSRLLPRYPDLNAHMVEPDAVRRFRDVNLGMAVDTPRGLLVPVIKAANTKSLAQISREAKELAKQAQDGAISPDDMAGGTFTVSNLGALGVESFTPVINPPETGILGVNNIIRRPREEGGEIRLYPAMGISLTYDHRAVDGAPASRFAGELCRMLERFTLLLAE